MSSPDIIAGDVEAVMQVLETSCLSIGPSIAQFEKDFAAYVGATHAIGVSSGTAGLHLTVIAAEVREDDVVITTPFSFVASANVIRYERATPVFVDIDPQTFNIDSAQIAQAAQDIVHGEAADRWLPPALRGHQLSAGYGRLKAIP